LLAFAVSISIYISQELLAPAGKPNIAQWKPRKGQTALNRSFDGPNSPWQRRRKIRQLAEARKIKKLA
jgi:hypothetical protein